MTAKKKLLETVEHLRKLADNGKRKQQQEQQGMADRPAALPSLGDRVSGASFRHSAPPLRPKSKMWFLFIMFIDT